MSWFKRENGELEAPLTNGDEEKIVRTEGLWIKCLGCRQTIWKADLEVNQNVCPKCQYHFKLSARQRLDLLLEPGYELVDGGLRSTDPLNFTDTKPYRTRLESSIEATGQKDAVIAATGRIEGIDASVAAMEYSFIGGSMGVVVGEKITRAIERAMDHRWPVVIVCSSGGARMMEGALSLMQMAKVSGALARLAQERLAYIAVLTDPTTGGVTASFAMLGDLNIAEPKALIGFAGPRVIEQTIRQKLPEGFQRAEFLLEKGMVDLVVDRREMKSVIAKALRFMGAAPHEPATTAAGTTIVPEAAPQL